MTTTQICLERSRLHEGQRLVKQEARRFNVIDCGRRWGKTWLGQDLTIEPLLAGKPVGWFSPNYKMLLEVWRELSNFYAPITARLSQTERRIEIISGGVLEMWSLENTDAGRSRKYARLICDEVGLVAKLDEIWNDAIRPTLTDLKGDAWFLSTPKGRNYFWTLYQRGQDPEEPDWVSWQMPTADNPFMDPGEIEAARRQLPERSFKQEYLAEFIEDGGGVFRGVERVVRPGVRAHIPAMPGRSYSMGVDLARLEDFTAITVLNDVGEQVFFERFNLVSWERQIDRILSVAVLYNPALVIDSTGVGDPVLEQIKTAACERNIDLTLVPEAGFKFTNTTKEQVVNALAIAIEHRDLALFDEPVQTAELMAYQYELTPTGALRMNAPAGMHDDCVIALALANWGRTQAQRVVPVGILGLADPEPDLTDDRYWMEIDELP